MFYCFFTIFCVFHGETNDDDGSSEESRQDIHLYRIIFLSFSLLLSSMKLCFHLCLFVCMLSTFWQHHKNTMKGPMKVAQSNQINQFTATVSHLTAYQQL